jgi:2,4-dienoyl-CoA reductase-like NADH-dependent reductase (Old Yellow Enzyme family)/NADPH-dependent 2,4-dienoyl-CoA reductase/sulfur reductase-like enzyme
MSNFDHVFQPLEIRGKTLRNRIQFSPHAPNLPTEDGEVTAELVEYVAKQAATGVGFLTISDCQIEQKSGASFLGELDIEKPAAINGLTKLAEAAHDNGALISIELSHAGAGANPDMIKQPAYSPSGVAIPAPICATELKVMDKDDMDHVCQKWVEAAVKCVTAGFDMVLVHMAHQNLLGQFLSPATNTRTDEYGGSAENRMRYPLEVLKAVREAVGEGTIIEIRLSAQEEVPGGMMIDEVVEFAKKAQKYADIINLSRGSIFFPAAGVLHMPSYLSERNLNVKFAEKVKAAVDIPVSVVGNIITMEDAEQILAEGKADIVGMARSLMAEPNLIKNAWNGQTEKSRPCLRCMECSKYSGSGRPIRCAVNPELGRELEYSNYPEAKEKKKVVVIGGGPAGMTAAQTCAQRGHEVVLFEKSDRLGGLLIDASALPVKELMRNYLAWSIAKTEEMNIDIRLNTEANMDVIEKENPDAVIVATGSNYIIPPIPGINLDNVRMVKDVDSDPESVGKNVIVCGAGISGIECAATLCKEGKNVTLLDMIPVEKMGSTLQPFLFMNYFLDIFPNNKVKLEGNCQIVSFDENGLTANTPDGEKHFDADTIVIALGVKPNKSIYTDVLRKYPLNSYFIGDCTSKGGTILRANANAYNAALKI